MNNRVNNFTIPAMMYGIYTSIPFIVVGFVFFLLGIYWGGNRELLEYAILIFAIYKGSIALREHQGGYLSYGRALAFGISISFYTSIIVGLFHYILFQFISPELFEEYFTMLEEAFVQLEQGNELDDTTIQMFDTQMSMMRKLMTPFTMWLAAIINITLWGSFFSLLISFFTKKKDPNPFSEIEEKDNQSTTEDIE